MTKRPATSSQVAKLAGVSQSAVSRAFTPGASVAEDTRLRVMDAARALGYRPNALARSLITSRSRMVGVVMAYLGNLFYPEVLELLGAKLQEHGYQMLLFTGFAERDSDPVFQQIMQYQVDGLLLASSTLSSDLAAECAAAGIPVLMFNRTTDRHDVSSVTSDNHEGGRQVARFLVEGGHRSFAYIGGIEDSSTNRDREAGFRAGLLESGVQSFQRELGQFSMAGAADATRRLFANPATRPDAIFCAGDQMAIGAIDVIRDELGLKVPQDVSVVGYDGSHAGTWKGYQLTTYASPLAPMVDAAVSILMSQITNRQISSCHEVANGELLIRSTSRIPPAGVQ